ncbi:diguanylate cyclase [Massilia sp. CF038]|uniref:GGDEF domain-containing protein n=1 Tax=Massilia sp. CF038 TaxID=1881045 RepID=UPI00091F4FE2|nr:diguanylate cyclase [Massilia sp. CF038]SHG66539.1 diguanylate cyclase (GGDEF) domain-containing protein [Massilia sp. CF038]
MTADVSRNEIAKQQALRMRRVLLASISYLFTLTLVAIFCWLGYFGVPVLINYFLAVLALNLVFCLAIRTNLNLRFADPSMTLVQICASILPGLYVMYHAQQPRTVFLLLCISAAMYGLFQFRPRDFVIMTLAIVGGYASLIALVYLNRPGEITLQVEILQLFAVFATFIQFSGLGIYIAGLRTKVKDKHKELAARNGELETALARIEELAMRDELTGVFNRRYLMESIRNEKLRCERSGGVFSICILDVDWFKQVNDTHGHLAGDQILQAIARCGQGALRQSDLFGRYGGEEFVMVLTSTMVEGAMITAERLRARIEALTFPAIDPQLRVTVSIGIAESRAFEDTALTFKRADEALYRAKQAGRNRSVIAAPAQPSEALA